MTRTEAIARALADELRTMATDINSNGLLRAVSFDVKLKPGTTIIRAVVVRPEIERTLNGDSS